MQFTRLKELVDLKERIQLHKRLIGPHSLPSIMVIDGGKDPFVMMHDGVLAICIKPEAIEDPSIIGDIRRASCEFRPKLIPFTELRDKLKSGELIVSNATIPDTSPDPREVECPRCKGHGYFNKCQECHGDGDVECHECGHVSECEDCRGTGYNPGEKRDDSVKCEQCDGAGKIVMPVPVPVIAIGAPDKPTLGFINKRYWDLITELAGDDKVWWADYAVGMTSVIAFEMPWCFGVVSKMNPRAIRDAEKHQSSQALREAAEAGQEQGSGGADRAVGNEAVAQDREATKA